MEAEVQARQRCTDAARRLAEIEREWSQECNAAVASVEQRHADELRKAEEREAEARRQWHACRVEAAQARGAVDAATQFRHQVARDAYHRAVDELTAIRRVIAGAPSVITNAGALRFEVMHKCATDEVRAAVHGIRMVRRSVNLAYDLPDDDTTIVPPAPGEESY